MLTSLKVLLTSVVDYAGVFPPAKLSLEQAISNYAREQLLPECWMLGRFVVPVTQLNLLIKLASSALRQAALSVVLTSDIEASLEQVQAFNDANFSIAALEVPPLALSQIQQLLPRFPADVETFFEIPINEDLAIYLDFFQQAGVFAKIRTGGIAANAFPSSLQLSQFIIACAAAQVPFKATAGLHHPLPGSYRLSYELDSPLAEMHGFLNMALLSTFAYWQKITLTEAQMLLEECVIDSFEWTENGISWREHDLTLIEIQQARRQFFRSFGSCSFREPIEDLKTLKLL